MTYKGEGDPRKVTNGDKRVGGIDIFAVTSFFNKPILIGLSFNDLFELKPRIRYHISEPIRISTM